MKAVAGFALVAAVHAAGWQDTPVDPAKSTTTTVAESTWSDYDPPKSTTTTKPVEETQSYWGGTSQTFCDARARLMAFRCARRPNHHDHRDLVRL